MGGGGGEVHMKVREEMREEEEVFVDIKSRSAVVTRCRFLFPPT